MVQGREAITIRIRRVSASLQQICNDLILPIFYGSMERIVNLTSGIYICSGFYKKANLVKVTPESRVFHIEFVIFFDFREPTQH